METPRRIRAAFVKGLSRRARLGALALVVLAWSSLPSSPAGAVEGPPALAGSGSQFWNFFRDSTTSDRYRLSAAQVLSSVIIYVRENYVDPARLRPLEMFFKALDNIEKQIPEVLIEGDPTQTRVRVAVGEKEKTFNVEGLDALWEITLHIRDIFKFIEDNLSLKEEELQEVEYAAVNGMLATLDPHSVFLPPKYYKEIKLSTRGEFGGLGIVISIRDAALTVISAIAGTPAARAGIKPQDKIVRINGESTVNMALDEAVNKLRGKPGTKVTIYIGRKGWAEPRKYVITRDVIKINSVSSKLLGAEVGYLKVKSFQKNTYDDMVRHLDGLQRASGERPLRGLVLDLRGNPGGLLDQAVVMADHFLRGGAIVITEGGGERKEQLAEDQGGEPAYPIIVLIDPGSASASEIVAGALKNHQRAALIGQRSFGKGTVQVLYDFPDKSALKLTVAEYLTPGGISIQGVGITPDIELNPVQIGKDGLHLLPGGDGATREASLDHALDSQQTRVARGLKPQYQLDYVAPAESAQGGADDGDASAEASGDDDEFKSDFEIELAQAILAQATSASRNELLRDAAAVIGESRLRQKEAIAAAFAPLGIDWRPCSAEVGLASSYGAAVTFTAQALDARGKAARQPVADGKVQLSATVTNRGGAPLCQLYAVTRSDSALFDRRELAFGHLAPGASKSWSIEVPIPRDTFAWNERVELEFKEINNHTPEPAALQLAVAELPNPQFAFTYQLDDSAGNGDGLLQVGEKITMTVHVRNRGPGTATQASASLKNLAGKGLYLDVGRAKIGELAPGQAGSGSLSFEVREELPEGARVKLSVYDQGIGEYLSEELTWPVGTEAVPAKAASGVFTAGAERPLVVFAGASRSAAPLASLPAGTALEALARVGAWLRVRLPTTPALEGFVHKEDGSWAAGGAKRRGARPAPELLLYRWAAPTLQLPETLPGSYTEDDKLRLSGSVQDDNPLKDMYVFVNQQKVYYRHLGAASTARADYAGPAPVKVDFEALLPLEEGPNTVTIVVRESSELQRRRTFGVYRKRLKPRAPSPLHLSAE